MKIISTKNILWYPCAFNDYRDLLFFHPSKAAELKIDVLPDIYIHTDRNPIVRQEEGYLFKDGKTLVEIVHEEQIRLFPDLRNETTIFDLRITSNLYGEFNRKLIYCVIDNYDFLREVILNKELKVSHLVTIRDGKDGLHKYLEYFLGILGTQYLISDNLGRGRVSGERYLDEVDLLSIESYYRSPKNSPVILNGISSLTWSEYGLFPVHKKAYPLDKATDAIVYKVVSYPALNANF